MEVVVLAAGAGTRMRTTTPKLLSLFAGRPLITHVLSVFASLEPTQIHLIVNPKTVDDFQAVLPELPCRLHCVPQALQLGTAHAVLQALPHLDPTSPVLISVGDVPLLTHETLQRLSTALQTADLVLLSGVLPDAGMLGRVLRDAAGRVLRIVEYRDASEAERAQREIFSGVLATTAAHLATFLPQIEPSPYTQETYLTDLVRLMHAADQRIAAMHPAQIEEISGINTLLELVTAERYYMQREAARLALSGVRIVDPARFDLRGTLEAAPDTIIDVNVIFEGHNQIGAGTTIGAHCVLKNVSLGAGVTVLPFTHIEEAVIEAGAQVGPFARIRPHTHLHAQARIGNFVEVKNSILGVGSKVNHLSYIGDTTIGARVNIGAGVVTVNYDGANKYRTLIEDDAFVGCDSQLIAPVKIGAGAFVGAGSTITADAPAGQLTLARVRQKTIVAWKRPNKSQRKLDPT